MPLSGRHLQHGLLFFLVILFIYFYFGQLWVFTVAWASLLLQRVGAPHDGGAWASPRGGFSCCRAQTLSAGSVAAAHGLSCSKARVIFPDPGIESMSPLPRQADSYALYH